MKPPRPTDGVARHCWGKRRRIAKKTEKGLWKAMARLGLLNRRGESSDSCSWEENHYSKHITRRWRTVPYIAGWEAPSYGCDDWSEWPIANIAHDYLDAPIWEAYKYDASNMAWPRNAARDDRHALQLLRRELRSRKRRSQKEGGAR